MLRRSQRLTHALGLVGELLLAPQFHFPEVFAGAFVWWGSVGKTGGGGGGSKSWENIIKRRQGKRNLLILFFLSLAFSICISSSPSPPAFIPALALVQCATPVIHRYPWPYLRQQQRSRNQHPETQIQAIHPIHSSVRPPSSAPSSSCFWFFSLQCGLATHSARCALIGRRRSRCRCRGLRRV